MFAEIQAEPQMDICSWLGKWYLVRGSTVPVLQQPHYLSILTATQQHQHLHHPIYLLSIILTINQSLSHHEGPCRRCLVPCLGNRSSR